MLASPAQHCRRSDAMLSSVFVDRPRLAVVIALVTAIAGLVSLLAIPIAQFPNIVPPQVSVTAAIPARPPRSSIPPSPR